MLFYLLSVVPSYTMLQLDIFFLFILISTLRLAYSTIHSRILILVKSTIKIVQILPLSLILFIPCSFLVHFSVNISYIFSNVREIMCSCHTCFQVVLFHVSDRHFSSIAVYTSKSTEFYQRNPWLTLLIRRKSTGCYIWWKPCVSNFMSYFRTCLINIRANKEYWEVLISIKI